MSILSFENLQMMIKALLLIILALFLLSNWVSKYKQSRKEDGGVSDLFLLIKKGLVLVVVVIFFINLF